MCGIFCYIYRRTVKNGFTETNKQTYKWAIVKENIARRGPDCLSTHFETFNGNWAGEFAASVLWMQGPRPTTQPCIDDEGNILLWNGDIFSGPLANDDGCDTLALLTELKLRNNINKTLSSIEGPYSFIYFQKETNLLFFGRDPIGRHSLLINIHEEGEHSFLTLCSAANKDVKNIIELPAIGIFSVDLNNSFINLSCSPWHNPDDHFFSTINNLNLSTDVKINKPILEIEPNNDSLSPMLENLSYLKNIPDEKYINSQEIIESLLEDSEISKRVIQLWELLKESLEIRIRKKPEYCKNCVKLIINDSETTNVYHKELISCNHTKIGILFSGGLDSTILAAITNEFVPENESIDLINVAFEKVKKEKVGKNFNNLNINEIPKFDVPDRKTGYQALEELQKNFPKRKWNFIEVNITREELQEHCSKKICHLIYPLKTILDESLGCAVWFASRGSGILLSSNESYESPCRVLLLGMGADELFGGYTRHRTILRRFGWNALNKELSKELSWISERNLGRDDRVVSDHGRQSRLPFLDEKVVKYVQSLKSWERCCPIEKMPSGLGDKLLLRLLAYKYGLKKTANFPKRAFQFGSRIANSKENAADTSNWLK